MDPQGRIYNDTASLGCYQTWSPRRGRRARQVLSGGGTPQAVACSRVFPLPRPRGTE